jgi:RNA polymerase sigma-B factor
MARAAGRSQTAAMLSSSARDDRLLRRHAARRDPADLEALVLRFRPLARSLARRYALRPGALEDLEQVALLGLVKAIKGFEPNRGYAFSSYAVPTIVGELKRWQRQTAWSAHVPRRVQERVTAVREAADRLAASCGRAPAVEDVAGALDCSREEVVDALCAAEALTPVALDRAVGADGDPGVDRWLGSEEPGYELAEGRASVEPALLQLSEPDRELLRLRYEDDLSHEGIARRMGMSPGQVAGSLRRSLARLGELAGESDAVAA